MSKRVRKYIVHRKPKSIVYEHVEKMAKKEEKKTKEASRNENGGERKKIEKEVVSLSPSHTFSLHFFCQS